MEITEGQLAYLEQVTPGTTAVYRLIEGRFEYLYVSPDLPGLSGMSMDEFLAIGEHDALAIVFPADRETLIAAERDYIENGTPIDCYFRVKHKTLGVDWAHIKATACGEMDGCPVFLAVYTNSSVETDIYQNILDRTDRLVLVFDRATHDILFANKAARNLQGKGGKPYYHSKCYRYLHGKNEPCNNCFMKRDLAMEPLDIDRFNSERNIWEHLTGTFTNWCGHDAFVQYIDDITERVHHQNELSNLLEAHEAQLGAMRVLQEHGSLDKRLQQALAIMGTYFEGDRAYLFQLEANGKTWCNSHEWCKAGVEPQIQDLQHLDFPMARRWMPYFDAHSPVIVSDVHSIREADPEEFALMTRFGIQSYVEAPLLKEGKLIGFVGVDNPTPDRLSNTADLLLAFAYYLTDAFAREQAEEALHKHLRDLDDIMTNIPVGISMVRIREGKIISKLVNPLLCDLYGIAADQVDRADEIARSRILEDYAPGVMESMRHLLIPGTAEKRMFPYCRKKGHKVRWYQMASKSVQIEDDLLIFSTLTDITAEKDAENTVEQNRRMYAAATELAQLAVWTYDVRTHRIIFSNTDVVKEDQQVFSIPQIIENVPDSLSEWVDDDDFDKLSQVYRDIDAGAPNASCEFWYKKRAGIRQRCERILYTTEFDEEGKAVAAFGIGMDVTAQKLEEQKYASLFEQMAKVNPYSLGTFHLNLTKNECTEGRSPYPSVMALMDSGTADGYLQANVDTVTDETIRHEFAAIFSRDNMLKAFRSGKTELSIEYPVRSSAGPLIWVDGFANMVQNPATHDIEAITYALNVTDRKVEEEIVNSITDDKYDHIGLIDPQARTFELRKRRWSFSHIQPNEPQDYDTVCREIAQDHVIPEDRELFLSCTDLSNLTEAMKEDSYSFIFRCFDADGVLQRKQVQYAWLDRSQSIIVNTQTDITAVWDQEQRQMQALEVALQAAKKANAAKSDFLSRMSHDIRTPLNGIIGMTYLASKLDNSPQMSGYLKNIDTSSKFLLGLINDVLDMSKAESGKLEMHPEPYDADVFFDYLDAIIRPLCNEKRQSFIVDAQPVSDVAPLLDPLRINQVFFNLLSNAVKYTPEGGTITYTLREKLLPDGKLDMTGIVSDTGVGMSESFQKVIFDPFTQENRDDASETRGSGLGLAIVKKIMDAMGGTVTVESHLGKGSTFTVHVVVGCVPAQEVESLNDDAERKQDAEIAGCHILLCEDHPLNQEIAKALLEDKGAVVTVAEDGQRGLEAFEQASPGYFDIILMDIRMPVMNGYQTAEALRGLERTDAKTVPIIAMTADAFAEDVRKCLDAGMNGHIAKPIDPQELYEIISRNVAK